MTQAQSFTRTRLAIELENPWEVIWGPDNYLWISEKGGSVVRVDPDSGEKAIVYTASDYFSGDKSEKGPCGLSIGRGTFGLALHPDFSHSDSSFVYLLYSYNSGSPDEPSTLFKIVKLTWDPSSQSVTAAEDLVTELANGYDHFGGRLLAVKRNGSNYLFYSSGDTGSNFDDCYPTPAHNPNNFTQDPYTKHGKIHRINMDGSIPSDNPIPDHSFFTRGHRNPQGLAYNPKMDVLYDIEHGHTTDDEVNVLEAGMNYGWKAVKGYHDGNYPGELDFVQNYTPHPDITGDALREPLFSWGATMEADGDFLTWPTVAPSDGIYYGSTGIPEWTNSLLVVTLKDGTTTNQEVFRLKLNPDGKSLAPSTPEDPNPKPYFGEDQFFNGRLRDIAISPDGKKIILITNNKNNDPIIVYTYDEVTTALEKVAEPGLTMDQNFPNPFSVQTTIHYRLKKAGRLRIEISNMLGEKVRILLDERTADGDHTCTWDGTGPLGQRLADGLYLYTMFFDKQRRTGKMMLSRAK